MNRRSQPLLMAVLSLLPLALAAAQAPSTAPAAPSAVQADAAPQQSTAQKEAGEPRASRPAAAAAKSPKPADRVELDTTTVTGNRELPKVMYVVPWKKSDIGDLGGKPMNSLLDEVLAPVDRDVFRREVIYYQAVKAESPQNGATGPPPPDKVAPPKQGEK
jgi:hypothetical protein